MSAIFKDLPDPATSPTALFLRRAAALLGYGEVPRSEREFSMLASRPVAPAVVERLVSFGVPSRYLGFITPQRTLSHRKARGEMLTPDESDRAVRAARLLALGETVFGDKARALQWLARPVKQLGGSAPLAMMASESGARLVEELLVGIDEGYFA
jgi:putative toxin-antitoxin system antitoxin component (TIGR02293 family)